MMTTKERNNLRRLQERLLATNLIKRLIRASGVKVPLWDNGPNSEDLRRYLYPQHAEQMKDFLGENNVHAQD